MTNRSWDKRVLAACAAGALACLLLALPGASPAGAAAGGASCAHANDTAADATLRQLRKALGCLINAERRERDRRVLRPEEHLQQLAKRHTRVMLEEDCFRHECPGERSLRKRIEGSGYVQPGSLYGYGENLGCALTPAGMVDAWMTSANRYHRRNILDRKFRHMGIGAGRGAPAPAGDKCEAHGTVTYTVIFGWRKPAQA